jgi:hypothetical protein
MVPKDLNMDYELRDRILRERRGSRPCRLSLNRTGRHQFGGTRCDLSYVGVTLEKPIHHFLTLDTNDPLCPVESSQFTKLPLVYPLLYGAGGGEIQYTVETNSEIHVHHLSECCPDSPYVDHDELPSSRASLVKLSYGEERLVCAIDGHFSRKRMSYFDRIRLNRCDGGDFWRVGGHFQSCQGPVWSLCQNSACDWSDGFGGDTKSQIWPIALIRATTRQLGDIWGEFSQDVEFYFGYCPHCGAIHVVNRCT